MGSIVDGAKKCMMVDNGNDIPQIEERIRKDAS